MIERLTVTQAAQKLGVTGVRIRQFIADGRLPARKVGPIYLIAEKDLARVNRKPVGWKKGRKRKRKSTPKISAFSPEPAKSAGK